MLDESLIADLVTELPVAVRLERLVITLKMHFGCHAVALLQLEQETLKPVAFIGLVEEVRGRRFEVSQHPRLAQLVATRQIVHFPPDPSLPDPYDGLVESHAGQSLAVHDCMGVSLYVEGKCWGVLTLDALSAGTFSRLTVLELQRFSLLVEAIIRIGQLENQLRQARIAGINQPLPFDSKLEHPQELIGQSPELKAVLSELDTVARTELPVLLSGETGVGKELFARRLLHKSSRKQKAMIYVNCAALPETLAESELFGHKKGAFSGAVQDRLGKFEHADGGTLFLDEIGELSLSVQAKLLRVLQNGDIQRLGSDDCRRVDVRVVAATNRDLAAEVIAGNFRADLFHRLSVYPIHIPPLRKRKGDIVLLAGHYLELNRVRLGVRALRLSISAAQALELYHWPGNVRELEHCISRAALKALSQGASRQDIITLTPSLLELIEPSAFSQSLAEPAIQCRQSSSETANQLPSDIGLKAAVAHFQREMIVTALQASDANWSDAARKLALDPSNLHKLAVKLGIKQSAKHSEKQTQ
jgi:anaerobic nitric oxide reductase transcription regulator